MGHEFVHELTDVDGKMWRTAKALFFEPGRLTAEYWAGHRGAWVRPLRLYIVVSTLTFLLAAHATGPLGYQVTVDSANNFMVGPGHMGSHGYAALDAERTHHIESLYLWLRYLSLGLFAAASLAVYRKRQRFYGAHLIFGLHFYSFEFALSGVMARLWPDANPAIQMVAGFSYLCASLHRIYGESWWRSAWKGWWLFVAVAVAESCILVACVGLLLLIWKK